LVRLQILAEREQETLVTDDLWKTAKSGDWADASNWSEGVPTNAVDALIDLAGRYTVAISTAVSAHDVTLNATDATLREKATGALSADTLALDAGTVILNGNSSIGNIDLTGGTLEYNSDQALGSAAINLSGGTFQATASTAISGTVALLDTNGTGVNIDAATGTTVKFGNWKLGSGEHHLVINAPLGTQESGGTIQWFGVLGDIDPDAGPTAMDIMAGTFQVLGGNLQHMLIDNLHVAANATLDVASSNLNLDTLNIDASGVLTNSLGDEAATVFVLNGSVAGQITGDVAIASVAGGTLTLSGDSSYALGTAIDGTVIATQDGSLGIGNINFEHGTLIGENNVRLAALQSDYGVGIDGATIAAAHGTVFVFDPYSVDETDGPIIFGDANGDDGKVVFGIQGGRLVPHDDQGHTIVEVRAGTLAAANDGGLSKLLAHIIGTEIDSDATLDAHGHLHRIVSLTGSGHLINSAKPDTMTLTGTTDFSGAISGAFDFIISGTARLDGGESFTGKATLSAGSSLTIGHLWSEEVDFAGAAALTLIRLDEFSGHIDGFAAGDTIDLKGFSKHAVRSWDAESHTLTVTDTQHSTMLVFDGEYTGGNFQITNDGTGHAEIVYHAVPAADHSVDLWG
jgi:hypothetical protein